MRSPILAFVSILALAPVARAEDAPAPPTTEQLAQAKIAFEEGNALFKAGKLDEAVLKLKESYRLSRNAFLLYNIGATYDVMGKKDLVLFYFKKFLGAAPATAPMRPSVEKRVQALEAEGVVAATPEGETEANDATVAPQPPPSKYSPADFKHETIDTAPPGWPIDIAARIPVDAGWTVKLYYRASGEDRFVVKPMTWRNTELVARIPGAKATGRFVQYYLEVRDSGDKLIARSGKSTSPNLVDIEANATKQYYADYIDEGGEVVAPVIVEPPPDEQHGEGKPSNVVHVAKWVTTGAAVALFGTSLVSYKLAGDQHDKLVSDSHECGTPPCRDWDSSFGERVQTLGKRYDTMYKVTLGVGVAMTGLAAYLWWRDHKNHRVLVAPTAGDGGAGATAFVEF